MKATVIFTMYYLLIGAVLGMATFLMYHKIDGWGWLIFIGILLAGQTLKVRDESSTKDE